jgi:hypothetical protein
MAVKFDDTQLQLLYDSLKSEIKSEVTSLRSELDSRFTEMDNTITAMSNSIVVMNNSINRLHDKVDSQSIFFQGFIDDTRNRLNRLERKTA